MGYKPGDIVTFKNVDGQFIDEKNLVKYRGKFTDIDTMSKFQRFDYKLKHKTSYKWKRHLAGNRRDNSTVGLTMTAMGLYGICNTDMIAGMLFSGLVLAYGCALIRARRKNGVLDKFLERMKDNDKTL